MSDKGIEMSDNTGYIVTLVSHCFRQTLENSRRLTISQLDDAIRYQVAGVKTGVHERFWSRIIICTFVSMTTFPWDKANANVLKSLILLDDPEMHFPVFDAVEFFQRGEIDAVNNLIRKHKEKFGRD